MPAAAKKAAPTPSTSKRTRAGAAAGAQAATKKAKVAEKATPSSPAASTSSSSSQPKSILKGAKKAAAPSPPSSKTSKRSTAKSPLTATKPVVSSDEDEDDEDDDFVGSDNDEGSEGEGEGESSIGSDDEAEMLRGMTSDEGEGDQDDADSSDEEEEDAKAVSRLSEVAALKLPSSKDDEAVRARLAKVEAKRKAQPSSQKVDRAVLYVGRLPRHFTELPLRSYLSQFGTVTRLRLSRNKQTGASKHYAFVEFADDEVAKIVQETMDNYLILGQLLRVKSLDKDDVHPKLWIGANRTYRTVPQGRRARVQHDGPKTDEGKQRAERKLLERQQKKKAALKEQGYDYDFEGYKPAVKA
ncbi:unnamed protein product [Parajaminaea phylloscopi]